MKCAYVKTVDLHLCRERKAQLAREEVLLIGRLDPNKSFSKPTPAGYYCTRASFLLTIKKSRYPISGTQREECQEKWGTVS